MENALPPLSPQPPAGPPAGPPPPPMDASGSGPEPKKSMKKPIALGVAGALAAVAVGGGVFAYSQLKSSSDYPYDHLASGAIGYVQVNTDPSVGQKLALNKLTKKFPELKEEDSEAYTALTAENLNEELLESMFDLKDLEGVGDRMAFALYPDGDDKNDDPDLAFLVEADDEKAAEKIADKLVKGINSEDIRSEFDGFTGDYDGTFPPPEEEPTEVKAKIYGKKWVAITDASHKDIFESKETLADDSAFTDRFDPIRGNLISAWGEVGKFSEAVDEEELQASGEVTFTLESFEDGLDLRSNTYGVKWGKDGEALALEGDTKATQELLNSQTHDNAILSLGFTGLGSMLEDVFTELDPDSGWGLTDGVTPQDLPTLIGNNLAVSFKGTSQEDLAVALALEGVDRATWERVLATEGMTVEDLGLMLSDELGIPTTISFEDDRMVAHVGEAPAGKGDFKEGQMMGSVDVDRGLEFISSFDSSMEDFNEGFGKFNFSSHMDEDGNGESILSWRTPR